MFKRRNFLKTTGAAALTSVFAPKDIFAAFSKKPHAIGLQLFTLLNVIDKDPKEAFEKVAAIGYKEIESSFSKMGPFYGMAPKEFGPFVKSTGMTWVSHHVLGAPFKLPPGAKMPTGADGKPITIPKMKNLRDDMQELVDQAVEGGIPFLVCANIPTNTKEDLKSSVEILNKTGEACKKAGITLAYHNHDEEFENVEGEIPYNVFLKQLTPDIKMELDLCWAVKGGVDPVALFKKHPGRFPLWHVKDLDKERKESVPVGEGVVDFKSIFDNASLAGMKHFFVEHDMPKDAYASITESYNYLTKVLHV
ncbi:MAG: sugar phosphate isomerase/epimerase [Ginsengibacter sp.]